MKRTFLVCILILVLLAGCQSKPSAEELVLSQVGYVENDDLEGAMTLYAEDVVYTMIGFAPEPEVFSGKAELRAWMETQYTDNNAIDIQVVSLDGEKVTTKTKFTSDFFRDLGIAWMECEEVYQVQDALIQEWSCVVTDESLAVFLNALNPPLSIADIAGKWEWDGEHDGIFFTFYEDGSYEFSRVIGNEEFVTDNGQVQLSEGMITYTSGDDSKYCPSGSLGIYEIALTDDGRLEFTLQEDACSSRRSPVEGPNYFDLASQ